MTETQMFSSVLLIEDDSSHALLIKRALKSFVDEVRHYENVADGIAALEESEPDLIVTDLNLPDSTNVEHVQRLREAGGDTPIVVLTSSTSLTDAIGAMQLGAQDFIVKNFGSEFNEVLGLSLSRVFASYRLEEERRKLQREMEVLHVAIESSLDGLAVVTRSGEVRWANSALRGFLSRCGGESGQLLSLDPTSIKKGSELVESLSKNLSELPGGALWHTEIILAEDASTAFDLSLSVIGEIEARNSNSPGLDDCVVWIRDISEQKQREKFQREILSTTTHDLKGPLGAIITGTELLEEMLPEGERTHQLVLRVGSAAHGILNMIEEFLSARRIKEGNFIMRPDTFPVRELLAEVRDNYDTIATARSIDLQIEIEDPDRAVSVDRLGFDRVLGNLLSNAFKFTPRNGEVRVTALCGESELRVEVADTGSGMEPAEAQHIFQRFSRLSQHDAVGGSGIGLFVVKCIVEAHGGKIEVRSAPGQGTTFTVTFPYEPPVNERGEVISLEFA